MKKLFLYLFLIPTFILTSFSYIILTDFNLVPIKLDAEYYDPWTAPDDTEIFGLGVSSKHNCPIFDEDFSYIDPPKNINYACVFYRDIDFDGNDEVIEQFTRAGQRRRDAFLVYKKNKEGSLKLITGMPFTSNKIYLDGEKIDTGVDDYTRFDPIHQTIHSQISGGWCQSNVFTHQKLDGKWVLISEVSSSRFFGFCTAQHYAVKNNKKELKFVNFYSKDVRQHLMKLEDFF